MKQLVLLASLLVTTSAFAYDVDPFGFEKEHFVSTMSRAEVVARSKVPQPVTMRIDDAGRVITPPSTRSREQVSAETLEAARFGLTRYSELGAVQATAEQERQIELAGQRAVAPAASAR